MPLCRKLFPSQPGGVFTQIAVVFWETYQSTQDADQACDAVTDFANELPGIVEILDYLGGGSGLQNLLLQTKFYLPSTIENKSSSVISNEAVCQRSRKIVKIYQIRVFPIQKDLSGIISEISPLQNQLHWFSIGITTA